MTPEKYAEQYVSRLLNEDVGTSIADLVEKSNQLRDEICKELYQSNILPTLKKYGCKIDESTFELTDNEGHEVEYNKIVDEAGCYKVLEDTPFDFHNDDFHYVLMHSFVKNK